jgi:hypothetical protein
VVSTQPGGVEGGAEAVEKAVAAGPKTEREKDYIAATAAFYREWTCMQSWCNKSMRMWQSLPSR